jgi:cytochrome c biogenesis protein CcmG/thiol:disulfide interchange protein DsbE
LVIGFCVLLATRPGPSAVNAGTALIGKPAPPIAGRSLIGGGEVSLSSDKGRFVYVDFFASWCAPCTSEAPVLAAFLLEHGRSHNVAVLGVDIDDTAGQGAQFLKRTFATWPAVEDVSGADSIAVSYGVDDPPQGYLIAPDGRVLDRIVGALKSPAQLDALIEAFRGGRS